MVQVVGSFTSPAWKCPLRLEYCRLRKIYVKYLKNLPKGRIELKFIVDGEYVCDGRLPTFLCNGIVNNYL